MPRIFELGDIDKSYVLIEEGRYHKSHLISNFFSVLFIWYALKKMGIENLRARYEECRDNAAYCEKRLQEMGIAAWRNHGAITVVMPKVTEAIQHKWQLATTRTITHILCMPNVTRAHIDAFLKDMKEMPVVEEAQAYDFAF